MKPFSCTRCTKRFRTHAALVQHEANHPSGDKPYGCEHCGRWFSSASALAQHSRATHRPEPRQERDWRTDMLGEAEPEPMLMGRTK